MNNITSLYKLVSDIGAQWSVSIAQQLLQVTVTKKARRVGRT